MNEKYTRIEAAVINLIACRARHKKKNTVMGEETWDQLIEHLLEEAGELVSALGFKIDEFEQAIQIRHINKENTLEELGDIYGILVHATIKAGFTMEQVEARELDKLKERFKYESVKDEVFSFDQELKGSPAELENLC
jgi:NTP pyrophosphatase (non-canonical NTP hydrolase)